MRWLLAAMLLGLFLLAWQGVASLESVDDLLVASPIETAEALYDDFALLSDNALVTLSEVLLGLLIAVPLGVLLAVAMHLVRPLRDAAYPLLVASQAIPIVVLAPIFVLAFDYGIGPKVAIVTLICFLPVTVNLLDGLRSVPPELLKLMRSLGASRLRSLRSVELPASLPYLFSGLKIAATVSVIGAVFGEWAGADEGLGRLVLLANNQLQTPRVYAGTVLLTADGRGPLLCGGCRGEARLPLEPKGQARMKRSIALVLAASLLAAGCGEKEDVLEPTGSKRVELMLDYFPNADHAGIYAAEAGGHFEQAGLDVEIRQPSDPAAPIKQVAAGRVDLAISYEPEVLRARDQDLRVVSVGRRRARAAHVDRLAARGRRSTARATCAARRSAPPASTTRSAYLADDPRRGRACPGHGRSSATSASASTPALLTGRVDAVLGAFWNYEGTELRMRGKRPRDHPHGGGRSAGLRRARPGRQRGRAGARRRQDPGVHRRAVARHARPARDPDEAI